jgi:hypothetical protein
MLHSVAPEPRLVIAMAWAGISAWPPPTNAALSANSAIEIRRPQRGSPVLVEINWPILS